MIYLDAASTEKLHPAAKEAMLHVFENWSNPSGLSQNSKQAKQRLNENRKQLKEIFNIHNNAELIFVSSASEANNIVINQSKYPVLISKFEHPSIENHPKIQSINLDFNNLENLLKKEQYLFSITLVNNEAGLMPITKELIDLIHKYGSLIHIDASQAKNINFHELNCDYMTISSHKIGGPIGVAGLITKTTLQPTIYGGGQEFNIKSGTEPLPLIEGFTAAASQLHARNDKQLYEILKNNINKKYFLEEYINNQFSNHIICLLTFDASGSELFAYMELNDIIVSYGSACSSGTLNAPKILQQFNLPSKNGIRISFGWHSTSSDIQKFCNLFNNYFKQ